MEYIYPNLPNYTRITSRAATSNAVVSSGAVFHDSTAITELSIGRSDRGGRMGIKNLKMWGRAMRNFIPANA